MTPKNGSKFTVAISGANLVLGFDGASGKEEKLCILSEQQAQPSWPGEKLNCLPKKSSCAGMPAPCLIAFSPRALS